eukprot:CAMPEP_0170635074 /NCGR_PEP_ID=MMETSP0224-20130122/37004_1 /TAXON_ID=285029 /ORGANISM="Togula jolla, Strain CCCM 725" /LENGTH=46 /DNA_ID= /DNA_START= /DNA_END= /DNA_ORIENTATION=
MSSPLGCASARPLHGGRYCQLGNACLIDAPRGDCPSITSSRSHFLH